MPTGADGKGGAAGSDGFAGAAGQDSGLAAPGTSAGDTLYGATTSDTTPPVVTLNAANVTSANARKLIPYTFTVAYSDPVLMDATSFSGTVVHVAQPGGGEDINATAIKTKTSGLQDGQGDTQTITVTYRFAPPGGVWSSTLNGTYTVNLIANPPTDLAGNGAATGALGTFSVNIPSPPIAFHPTSLPAGKVGAAYHQAITATGGSGKLTVTYNITSAPPVPDGLTFTVSGSHLKIGGKPTIGGPVIFSITATDLVAHTATQSYTLIIKQKPKITSPKTTTFTMGVARTFTVTVSGYPVPGVTESGALPSGLTFDRTTYTLSGSPAAGTVGTYPLTFTVHNGVGPDATQKFTLTVNPAAFTVGSSGSFTVRSLGAATSPLHETGTLPSGVTFTDNHNGTATVAGTPAADTGGTFAFSITSTTAAGSISQSFTLTVDQAASITSADNTAFMAGTSGSFTVTTTGYPTATLSETGALPSGVTFTDNGNGTATLSGAPAVGTSGTYDFTISAANGIGSDASQSFTLNVN
jgi:hypothetical protein